MSANGNTPLPDDDGYYAALCAELGLTPVDEPPHTDAKNAAAPRLGKWAREMWHEPPPAETIEGVAWASLITVLVSESGAGKTFVLLDAAAAVSAGLPWHGRTTQEGTVAYCSFEGDAIGLRLRAMNLHAGHRFDNLAVIRLSDPISPQLTRDGEIRSMGEQTFLREIAALRQDIADQHRPPLRLIVIDTIRASMTGSEDASDHTSAYLRVARRVLAETPDAACVLAHHAGWQDGEQKKKRERGSSSWRGNVDATLYLEAGEYDRETGSAPLTLTTLKVRDAERPAPLRMIRQRVTLNESDPRGQPVTSCVIERETRSLDDIEAEGRKNEEAASRTLDLKTLRVIAERPSRATSQNQLRLLVGVRKLDVGECLSRLIQRGWVTLPEKQRQPYQVTPAGLSALNGGD